MRERQFIEQNKQKWMEFEQLQKNSSKDPDKLSDLFVEITDDLSYARTFYPARYVRVYLNRAAGFVFYSLYKNRKPRWKTLVHFWKEEMPQLILFCKNQLLLSLLIFLASVAIGVFSSMHDPHYVSQILGGDYVEQTLENIRKGDPLGVYKEGDSFRMFLAIATNNISITFFVFLGGLLAGVGTVYLLMSNGIMLGCFQYLFYQHNLLSTSLFIIWLHGTFEISTIIIAGGAGLTLGSGLLFPGTYSRLQSFQLSAGRALKLLVGTLPILVVAAFIESFVTRYTDTPDFIKGILIAASLLLVLGYYVWYPLVKGRKGFEKPIRETALPPYQPHTFLTNALQSNGEILVDVFAMINRLKVKIFKVNILATCLTLAFLFAARNFLPDLRSLIYQHAFDSVWYFFNYPEFPALYPVNVLTASLMMTCIFFWMSEWIKFLPFKEGRKYKLLASLFIKVLFAIAVLELAFFINPAFLIISFLLLFPVLFLIVVVQITEQNNIFQSARRAANLVQGNIVRIYVLHFSLAVLAFVLIYGINASMTYIVYSIISWNFYTTSGQLTTVFAILFFAGITFLVLNFLLALFSMAYLFQYFSLREILEANGLRKRIFTLRKPVPDE